MRIARSDDGGETWGTSAWLSESVEGTWHQSACNVWYTRGNVYLVMEMAIDGDDLCVVSRSGDRDAKSPHDTDLITFHRISDFRSLVY